MPKVYSKALNKAIDTQRIIGKMSGQAGPCLIFLGGIHGNEPSGIFAIKQVFDELAQFMPHFRGTVYGISGNLWALERQERFHTSDLNRLWTRENIEALEAGSFVPKNKDEEEQLSIQKTINQILAKETGPFYFFDLHTTSSETIPFITINDSLINRKFTSMYPLPLILGIEEYLDGPLLSYINELGYVSLGFESGQHDALASIGHHKIFIYLSLVFGGVITQDQIPFDNYLNHWKKINPEQRVFYEIFYQHAIKPKEAFKMYPGFLNFQTVPKGKLIATSNGVPIVLKKTAKIFMPLYQEKGDDGYFLIKRIPRFLLWLSAIIRQLRLDSVFPVLPGVSWSSSKKETMVVNLKIARFITRPLFHLFGYRSKQKNATHISVRNREYNSKKDAYKQEKWYT